MSDREVWEELQRIEHVLRLILKVLRHQGHEIEEIEGALEPHHYPRTTGVKVSQQ